MTRLRIFISALLILALAAIVVLPRISFQSKAKKEKNSPKKQSKTIVHAKTIHAQKIDENLSITGSVLPYKEVNLTSETAGRIVNINFEEGQVVEKGELLLELNDGPLQAQLQQAMHRKGLLQKQLERKAKLLEKEGISQAEYDQSQTDLESIKAEIRKIREQIDQTEVRAPFNGIIGLKHVDEGSYISSSTQVAQLRQTKPVKLEFSIPGKYAHLVKQGQKVSFENDFTDSTHTAKIYATEPGIDKSTRTLQVRALYPNKAKRLIPGQFVTIDLTLTTTDQALLVPTEALVPELGGQKLFLYQNGKSVPKQVETGKRMADQIRITSGIKAGDTVITNGIQNIGNGTPVEIKVMK